MAPAAAYYARLPEKRVQCLLCPRQCTLAEGQRGNCLARQNRGGEMIALTYGRVSSLAMDPIEKKPLYHFFPGRFILSLGGWGCNLHCAFCQNHSISQAEAATQPLSPAEAVRLAQREGSIGIAYTYNEPLIAWEYLRDCCAAIREAGLKNVLVTNGYLNPEPLAEILPLIDAMNIDIKAFRESFYREICGGSLAPVLRSAELASRCCHVEVTTLLIPGQNDDAAELDELAAWIAAHCGKHTPTHLSAYFPRYRFRHPPTSEADLRRAREIFRRHLRYIYLGNIVGDGVADTLCQNCAAPIIRRRGYEIDASGMDADGRCAACGADNGIITS
ncbi:MAG: AmmeMemoRadiSam system radical SAM enzyme [Planctomycetota bacterium]|nr:AmmeMemoRadiSam system radical SAM enzyme [Planctomycetota bacterium]